MSDDSDAQRLLSPAASASHEDVIAAAAEIAAVEPVLPVAADTADEPNPFEQPAAAAAAAASSDAPGRSRSHSHSHAHPHDAHSQSHAAPLLMGSSHGAYVQGGFDMHSDLVLDTDAASTAGTAGADDDPNPFDTPHLPAHSRAVHHRLDVAPVGAADEKVECADEIVPPWREEMRTLLTLALPAVLINLTSVAMMTVGQMFVGHLSVEALAACVCSTMYFNCLWMFVFGFAGALDTLASQSFGAGSMEGVTLWTKRALVLISILTIPVMIGLLLGYPVLRHLLGQSEEISQEGAMYCRWLILGLWPQNLTIVLQKYLQSQSLLWPVITQGIQGNVANIVLESILIWGCGLGLQGSVIGLGLARWIQFASTASFCLRWHRDQQRKVPVRVSGHLMGASAGATGAVVGGIESIAEEAEDEGQSTGFHQGAGIGAAAAAGAASAPGANRFAPGQMLTSIRSGSMRLVRGVRDGVVSTAQDVARGARSAAAYAIDPRALIRDIQIQQAELMEGVWNKAAIWQFIKLGASSGAITGIEAWAFDGIGILAATMTVTELDAHYCTINIALTTYFTLPLGVAIAASIRIGHLVGMGHVKTAQLTAKLVACCGAGFMAITGSCISASRNVIGYIFSSDDAVVAQVARIAPILGLFQLFDGIQGSTGGVLRGLGLQHYAAIINCVGLWLCGLPTGWALAFPAGVGLPGLWWGLAIGLFIMACGNLTVLYRVNWHTQVESARKRIETDLAEYAARRAEVLAEASKGAILGSYEIEPQDRAEAQRMAREEENTELIPL